MQFLGSGLGGKGLITTMMPLMAHPIWLLKGPSCQGSFAGKPAKNDPGLGRALILDLDYHCGFKDEKFMLVIDSRIWSVDRLPLIRIPGDAEKEKNYPVELKIPSGMH